MRNYLQDIEIVGATMCYMEREQCHWSLDWLFENCDRVVILLDNYDKETEKIVLSYKDKYPDKASIVYSSVPINEERNMTQGQPKKRFKLNQHIIREQVIQKLHELNKEKPVDLFIFLDSDEIPIYEFPKYLEEFWNNRSEKYMMLGFVEVFDKWNILMSQKMAPHNRVYKFDPTMTALPYTPRTRYHPYENGHPWKVRHILVHLNHFTEEYRNRRQFVDNVDWKTEFPRYIWILPKDVREMMAENIGEYQPGQHRAESKYPSISLQEYLDNKEKYNN